MRTEIARIDDLAIAKRSGVVYVDQRTGSAMSVPTVLTIPGAVDQLAPKLGS